MKKILVAIGLFFSFFPRAFADTAGTGVGLMLGVPSGVTARSWINEEHSVDLGAGWSIVDSNRFQVHADFLWARPHTFELNEEKFDLFFGGGVGVRSKSGSNNNELVFGPRLPVGVSYLFANPDLELFVLGAVNVGILPSSDIYFDLLAGARFYVF
jgi:hypothetical protein